MVLRRTAVILLGLVLSGVVMLVAVMIHLVAAGKMSTWPSALRCVDDMTGDDHPEGAFADALCILTSHEMSEEQRQFAGQYGLVAMYGLPESGEIQGVGIAPYESSCVVFFAGSPSSPIAGLMPRYAYTGGDFHVSTSANGTTIADITQFLRDNEAMCS
ncbi:MAG: hypothetical protein ABIQ04_00400 [Candidatus Saccharimonadales bacterium]